MFTSLEDSGINFRPYLSERERLGTTLHTTFKDNKVVSTFPGEGVTIIVKQASSIQYTWGFLDNLFPPVAKVCAQIERPGRERFELFTSDYALTEGWYATHPVFLLCALSVARRFQQNHCLGRDDALDARDARATTRRGKESHEGSRKIREQGGCQAAGEGR